MHLLHLLHLCTFASVHLCTFAPLHLVHLCTLCPFAPLQGARCEVQEGARLEDVGVGLVSIRHGWACIKGRKQPLFVYVCGDFVRSVIGARCEVSGARCKLQGEVQSARCEVQEGARLEDAGVGLASIRPGWVCIKANKQTLFVCMCGDFARSVRGRGARCKVRGARRCKTRGCWRRFSVDKARMGLH